ALVIPCAERDLRNCLAFFAIAHVKTPNKYRWCVFGIS
ncbi:MAG: hypothetical protein ACI96P_001414, partial [Candidatus Azotimanducaceae bacterium]